MSKAERKAFNANLKRREQPRMLWPSSQAGTYVREQHGPLPGHK